MIEKAVLSHLLKDPKKLVVISEKHIGDKFFSLDSTKIIFRMISWFNQTYNTSLDDTTVDYLLKNSKYDERQKIEALALYKELVLLDDKSNFDFLLDGLMTEYKTGLVKSTLMETVSMMEQKDTKKALDVMRKGLSSIESLNYLNRDKGDARSDIEVRQKQFDDAKLGIKQDSVLLGFPSLDRVTGGIQKGELWTLSGWFKSCKSMMLLNIAYNAWNSGKNVIYVTAELSKVQLLRRFDALGSRLSYNNIKFGNLSNEDEKHYKLFLEDVKKRDNAFQVIYEPGCSTPFIRTCVREMSTFRPVDLVIADYIALISPSDCSGPRWEREGMVALELKQIAGQEGTRVITANQINREGHEKKSAGAEFTAGSIDVPRHADLVLSLWLKDEEEKKMNNYCEIEASITATRDSPCIKFICDAYLDKMLVQERLTGENR